MTTQPGAAHTIGKGIVLLLWVLGMCAVSAESLPAVTPADADWLADGTQAAGEYGFAVATGDINGDSYADLAIGAPKHELTTYREGAVFIYYGGPGGLSQTAADTLAGGQSGARFGAALAFGHVNGDPYADLIVGAHRYNGGEPEEGQLALYLGSADGLTDAPVWTAESDRQDAELGFALATGDLNGDGFDDIAAGARRFADGEANEGAVFVYDGSAELPSLTPTWLHQIDQPSAAFGSAVACGNVNGDAYADLLVGAPTFDDADANDVGAAYLFDGSATGPEDAASWSRIGPHADAWLGAAVALADANGDGYADAVIGAPRFGDGADDEGALWVFAGGAGGLRTQASFSAEGDIFYSQLGSALGAGDTNHDGYDDVVAGAPLFSGDKPEEGSANLFCGGLSGIVTDSADWRAVGAKAEAGLASSVAVGDVNGDQLADVILGAPRYRQGEELVGRVAVFHGRAWCPPDAHLFVPFTTAAANRPNPALFLHQPSSLSTQARLWATAARGDSVVTTMFPPVPVPAGTLTSLLAGRFGHRLASSGLIGNDSARPWPLTTIIVGRTVPT